MKNTIDILTFLTLIACNVNNSASKKINHNIVRADNNKTKIENSFKEKLNVPFGTLVKLKVKIIDGDQLRKKLYVGTYLIEISEVNSMKLDDTIIMIFKDATNQFPKDDFELYEQLYGKKIGRLSSEQIENMKKNYVGKTYDILAYESGKFVGMPQKSEYVKENIKINDDIIATNTNFYFDNYIVIYSKLND